MKKEQTEEQVQDNLQDENGGGGSHRSVKRSERCKTLFWVTLVSIVLAAILIILFAT